MLHKLILVSSLLSLATAAKADSFSVMTFNLENLFDTKHDEGKLDWAYLPKSLKGKGEQAKHCQTQTNSHRKYECEQLDWNDDVLDAKMKNLSKVILHNNSDVVIVQEVENLSVLKAFQEKYLKSAGYKSVTLIEGKDKRGIDVGMISKLDIIGKPIYHQIPYPKAEWQYTRGILEVNYKLKSSKTAAVFGVHFPSAANPHVKRALAMEFLNELAAKSKADVVVAGGDFNSISTEDSRLFRKLANDTWLVSHLEACKTCIGTNYYERADSWSFLDVILVAKKSSAKMDYSSVKVANSLPSQRNMDGSPKRFHHKKKTGVSDHFPLFSVIKY